METKNQKYILITYSDWELVVSVLLILFKIVLFYILFKYIVNP